MSDLAMAAVVITVPLVVLVCQLTIIEGLTHGAVQE